MIINHTTKQRVPRYKRVDDYPSVHIGRPKLELLKAISIFQYLSAYQLTRLLFSPGSLKYVRDHLKDLYHLRYLQRLQLYPDSPFGSPLAIYTLDARGYRYLQWAGAVPEGRFKPTEQSERQQLFLRHTLAANDLLILAHCLARHDPSVTLQDLRTERQLKRQPSYVQLRTPSGRTERMGVIPDGWVYLLRKWPSREEPGKHGISFELDRNTIERKHFQKKIRGLVEWSKEAYFQAFPAPSLTIAVVTTATDKRLTDLLSWTETQLTESKAEDYAPLFLFAAFDPSQADPSEVFLEPRWIHPLSGSGVPLLLDPSLA